MTFDDGIVNLYTRHEVHTPGEKPYDELVLYDRFYFHFEHLGITRYYTALQAGQQVDCVISIPGWHEITAHEYIAVITDADGTVGEGTKQYRVMMIQPTHDQDNLRITQLTLEKVRDDDYAGFSG